MKPTLLLYCQHSVGIGHLTRSFALAQALTREFHVVFLNGGPVPEGVPVPRGIEILDLPPLGLEDGHQLVARHSQGDVATLQHERRAIILAAFARVQPDVVFVELFPFGRKKFAFELLPLLKAARRSARRPIVVSSLRDILVAARPDQQHHDDRAAWLCRRYFDAVLVHADERLAKLEDTFRPRRPPGVPILYTGFAVPERASARGRWSAPHERSILVSAGGGQVGYPLLRAALDAHDLLARDARPRLDLITGPFLPEAELADLAARVEGRADVVLERVVPDLVARMRQASMSVSQCGYNTAMDIVAAGVPALVVPYAAGREDEQTNRARRMQDLGLLRMLDACELDAPRLARAIEQTLEFRPRANVLNLDGARCTASELYRLWSERHMPRSQMATA